MRDTLPDKIKKELGIVYLDSAEGEGTHWVCRSCPEFTHSIQSFCIKIQHIFIV